MDFYNERYVKACDKYGSNTIYLSGDDILIDYRMPYSESKTKFDWNTGYLLVLTEDFDKTVNSLLIEDNIDGCYCCIDREEIEGLECEYGEFTIRHNHEGLYDVEDSFLENIRGKEYKTLKSAIRACEQAYIKYLKTKNQSL